MALGPPPVGRAVPPVELDRLIDRFDAFCDHLVLLEEYSLAQIRTALETIRGPVELHCRAGWEGVEERARDVPGAPELYQRLTADHARFDDSLGQLDWYCAILARENHGGHRQALGQYGRVLAESFRRHREEEREFLRRTTDPSRPPLSRPVSGKRY